MGNDFRRHFTYIINTAHTFFTTTECLLSIITTPRIKFTCGIIAIIVSKVNLKEKFWISRNPGILNLLETLQPLNLLSDQLPESCYEAKSCLKLFDDVQAKIVLFTYKLKDKSIEFDHLHYYYQNTNRVQEFRKIARIVEVDQDTLITIEEMNSIFEDFIAFRTELIKIMLPSYCINNQWY